MPIYNSLFSFSSGLSKTLKVPKGTCKDIQENVEWATRMAGLKIEKYLDNPPHWTRYEPAPEIDNETACDVVRNHNDWVKRLYADLAKWSKTPPEEYEEMTPEFAQSIWYGLSLLSIPLERWTKEYYKEEMQRCFDIMTGVSDIHIHWDAKKLNPRQAMEVIRLFEDYLDSHDMRLELPKGGDTLLDSDEYFWCPKHGAIPEDEARENKKGQLLCSKCREIILN